MERRVTAGRTVSVATEINNHPVLPGDQKYGALPGVYEKVNAETYWRRLGKVVQVVREPVEGKRRQISKKERKRERETEREEDRRKKKKEPRLVLVFRDAGHRRDLPCTLGKLSVCVVTYPRPDPPEAPQFVKGDPSVSLTRQQICLR